MSACAAGLKPVHTVEGIKSYELDNGLQIVLLLIRASPRPRSTRPTSSAAVWKTTAKPAWLIFLNT